MSKLVICDLDGTIADLTHRLHFIEREDKDWDSFYKACITDKPHRDIIRLLLSLHEDNAEIMYVTGRSDMVRKQTLQWLELNGAPAGELRMRRHGDYRPDYIIKAELIEDIGPSQVWLWLEDRDQVVEMARSRGFRVLQVADGKF